MIAGLTWLGFSGGMALPQNGQVIGARSEPFPCLGATVHPSERIAIQARGDYGWITLAETVTETDSFEWESGTWYPWYVEEVTVPSRYWHYAGWV